MTDAESMLRVAAADLNAVGARWALIGGLAVAFRTVPRFTKDVDLVVAVTGDAQAESVVRGLRSRGYHPGQILEQDYTGRMSTVRLACFQGRSHVIVDLLFASSGIEPEIVAAADLLEVLPGVRIPVASAGHLIVLKSLAGRNQDLTDLGYLIPAATDADLEQAREAAKLIQTRGFHRGENVPGQLEFYIEETRR